MARMSKAVRIGPQRSNRSRCCSGKLDRCSTKERSPPHRSCADRAGALRARRALGPALRFARRFRGGNRYLRASSIGITAVCMNCDGTYTTTARLIRPGRRGRMHHVLLRAPCSYPQPQRLRRRGGPRAHSSGLALRAEGATAAPVLDCERRCGPLP